MKLAVFDLDNCISDDAHRVHLINKHHDDPFERFHAYHSRSAFDDAHNIDVIESHFNVGCEIIFCTGRPEWYRHMTQGWLEQHNILYDSILMRPNGERRASKLLKPLLLNHYNIKPEQIECAYDDRPDVVEAYLAAGINAQLLFINYKVQGKPDGER